MIMTTTRHATQLLALALIALSPLGARAAFLDCVWNDGFQGEAVTAPANWKAHVAMTNCARKTVVPAASPAIPVVTWDASIASTAQAWANQCRWLHSGSGGLGENLAAKAQSSGFPANPEPAAAQGWANEFSNYNYAANTCTGVCGHYTQMVWRGSTRIGCGFKNCTTGSPFLPTFPNWTIVVCNYSPAGNSGGRPY